MNGAVDLDSVFLSRINAMEQLSVLTCLTSLVVLLNQLAGQMNFAVNLANVLDLLNVVMVYLNVETTAMKQIAVRYNFF